MNHKAVTTSFSDLAISAPLAAQRLLGAVLIRTFEDGSIAQARIVETEAYDQTDAASHSYKHRTPRTTIMFGPAGFLYVYFTYGMHYCMNVVCGGTGEGAAVLIRAIEPLTGAAQMAVNRGGKGGTAIGNGPAKACQALLIDKALNGHNLMQSPLQLKLGLPFSTKEIVQTTRIGISQAVDTPWRFYLKDNSYVSKL